MMSRRAFLKSLTALVGGFALPAVARATPSLGASKTLQISPVAGFQYHHGETLWPQLSIGQPLQLVREADNRYDDRAVRVEWQGYKLGYIPRLDNAAVSQLMDRGERLEAVIAQLAVSRNPWERVGVEVRWQM
ncbi:MAG: HIRAN protein [Gallionellales bacterium GWA2_60_18]|nr:MAG: HIRAN protein [Gallionellales bacterium GWA2_60_18]